MGKSNFIFQKRQKELAKKKKSEEKRQRSWKKISCRLLRISKVRPNPVPTTTSDRKTQ